MVELCGDKRVMEAQSDSVSLVRVTCWKEAAGWPRDLACERATEKLGELRFLINGMNLPTTTYLVVRWIE